jgi:hypothetical protein
VAKFDSKPVKTATFGPVLALLDTFSGEMVGFRGTRVGFWKDILWRTFHRVNHAIGYSCSGQESDPSRRKDGNTKDGRYYRAISSHLCANRRNPTFSEAVYSTLGRARVRVKSYSRVHATGTEHIGTNRYVQHRLSTGQRYFQSYMGVSLRQDIRRERAKTTSDTE